MQSLWEYWISGLRAELMKTFPAMFVSNFKLICLLHARMCYHLQNCKPSVSSALIKIDRQVGLRLLPRKCDFCFVIIPFYLLHAHMVTSWALHGWFVTEQNWSSSWNLAHRIIIYRINLHHFSNPVDGNILRGGGGNKEKNIIKVTGYRLDCESEEDMRQGKAQLVRVWACVLLMMEPMTDRSHGGRVSWGSPSL